MHFIPFFIHATPTSTIYTLSYTTLFRSRLITSVTTSIASNCGWSTASAMPTLSRGWRSAPGILVETRTFRILSTTRKRSEEHTSELQSQFHLVCRLLLEKKNPVGNAGTE